MPCDMPDAIDVALAPCRDINAVPTCAPNTLMLLRVKKMMVMMMMMMMMVVAVVAVIHTGDNNESGWYASVGGMVVVVGVVTVRGMCRVDYVGCWGLLVWCCWYHRASLRRSHTPITNVTPGPL